MKGFLIELKICFKLKGYSTDLKKLNIIQIVKNNRKDVNKK